MKLEHSRVNATTNKQMVQDFLLALKELQDEHHYEPDAIWNFDETPFKLDEIAYQV